MIDTAKNIEALWKVIKDPKSNTMMEHLGMKFTEITPEYIRGTMPIDHRTIQYYGLLHGGASVAFAESLASIASVIHIDMEKDMTVGLEINANHIKTATGGLMHGEAKPIHIGSRTQIWSIELKNEEGKLLCISRFTVAVVPKRK